MQWAGAGSKAWVSAKAPVWVTGLGWMVAQLNESESEAEYVRSSLWETPRFALLV